MQETRVQFLGLEDTLKKEMATHFSILPWIIPWTEEPEGLQSMGSQGEGHNWSDSAHNTHTYTGDLGNSIPKETQKQELSSVQFSSSVMSDSLWPHGLQHARPPCPSSTPGVYSNLCPLSQWCHPTILSSVIPFSSCLWISSSHQVAKVLEFQLQHQSFQ